MFCRGCGGAFDRIYIGVFCADIGIESSLDELDSDVDCLYGGWRHDYIPSAVAS